MTAKVPKQHVQAALTSDDGRNDRDNPIVPFRMSDRITIAGLELKINLMVGATLLLAGLIGTGMALTMLHL